MRSLTARFTYEKRAQLNASLRVLRRAKNEAASANHPF
jgi:hypothetical protein